MGGQTLIAVATAILIFMVGALVVDFIKDPLNQAYSDNGCSSPTSDGGKLLCLSLDITVIYWILLFVSLAGGVITDRLLV